MSRPKRARSLANNSANVSVAAARNRNISVFAAMYKYGMLFHEIQDNAVIKIAGNYKGVPSLCPA